MSELPSSSCGKRAGQGGQQTGSFDFLSQMSHKKIGTRSRDHGHGMAELGKSSLQGSRQMLITGWPGYLQQVAFTVNTPSFLIDTGLVSKIQQKISKLHMEQF